MVRELDDNLIKEANELKEEFPDKFGFGLLKTKLHLCTRVTNELLEAINSDQF